MTREEMLAKLHSIDILVELEASPDGCMSCKYCTSKGFSSECMEADEWPLSKIVGLDKNILCSVAEKASAGMLTVGDIEGTVLITVFKDNSREEALEDPRKLNAFFAGIGNLDDYESEIYLLNTGDSFDPVMSFYTNFEAFKKAFIDSRWAGVEAWESYDDDELENFVESLCEFDELQIYTYEAH